MGDSDEESYDRRRVRDKFRGERSDYERRPRDYRERRDWGDRRREWGGGGRDNWDARGEARKRPGQYYGRPGRENESGGQVSPPMKRNRRDWDASFGEDYNQGFGGGGGMGPSGGGDWGAGRGGPGNMPLMGQPMIDGSQPGQPDMGSTDMPGPKVPRMMTFKEFLNAQEDDIDDIEAVRRFQEYKTEFKRTQLSDFFVLHKEEEWFKVKYHPSDSSSRKKEIRHSIRKRLRIFLDLLETGYIDSVTLDGYNGDVIMKLLDTVVIKLEGGTDEELIRLEQLYAAHQAAEEARKAAEKAATKEAIDAKAALMCVETKVNPPPLTSVNPPPLSPSSVPLPPDAPPPPPEESTEGSSEQQVHDQQLIPEQQQLQQQAQLYQQKQHNLQMESSQQPTNNVTPQKREDDAHLEETHHLEVSKTKPKKEKGEKEKNRKRCRESYQYDEDEEDEESESESESDSSDESEPAPPGEDSDIITTEPEEKETDETKQEHAEERPAEKEPEIKDNTDEDEDIEDGDIVPPGTEEDNIAAPGTEMEIAPPEQEPLPPGMEVDEEPGPPGTEEAIAHGVDGTEQLAELDPAPPGIEEEPYHQNYDQNGTIAKHEKETEHRDENNSSDEGDDKQNQWEHRKGSGLGAFLGLLRHESLDESAKSYPKTAEVEHETKEDEIGNEVESDTKEQSKNEQSNQNEINDPEHDEEEKRQQKEERWEHRKGSGLGALLNLMRGDGQEEEEKDDENEEEDLPQNEKEEIKESEKEQEKECQQQPAEVAGPVNKETAEQEHISEGRHLHKTLSLFMRNVPPNISKGDIAAVCKRYPGFLRVALADPSPERRFFRRGWATFENIVNIKDICWNLSNIRIKDCELNPVVNRDLSKRIRPINGITVAKEVVRCDIKFAANLIKALDEKYSLYLKDVEEPEKTEKPEMIEAEQQQQQNGDTEKENVVDESKETTENADETENPETKEIIKVEPPIILPDENPVLLALPEIATEEEEGEEMELIGEAEKNAGCDVDFTRDGKLMKALDKLLLYLRIVHSIDYYNGSDYTYEDEMPNRCGIIHVRGPAPDKASQAEVSDWQKTLEQKMEHYMKIDHEQIPCEEADKLGKKIHDSEIENFIKANIQELGKDKWLCPLSGKKFRAAEFVRKHIFNKHADKVDAVRLEVDYFNNYLHDKNRPQFPDPNQMAKSPAGTSMPHHQVPYGQQQQQPMYPQMGWSPQAPMMMYAPRGPFTPPTNYGNFGRGVEMYGRGGGHTYPPKPRWGSQHHRDTRKIIQYRDLDAPDDMDFF